MVSDGTKRCRRGRESGRTHSKCCSSVVERVVVAKELERTGGRVRGRFIWGVTFVPGCVSDAFALSVGGRVRARNHLGL